MLAVHDSAIDLAWMRQAISLAQHAEVSGEVPVGAVLVQSEQCIATGWNQPITTHDVTAHAEVVALRVAGAKLKNYRLPNTTLYVTLEPCVMCVGSLIHARVSRVVYGAKDYKTGAAGSVFDLLATDKLNHSIAVTAGVLAEECGALLQAFFRNKRNRHRHYG